MRKSYPLYHGAKQQKYSKGVVAEGRFAFLGGCSGHLPDTDMIPPTMAEQMEVAWNKIEAWLEEMGTSCENIVQTVTSTTDVDECLREWWRLEQWWGKNCPTLLEERIPDMLVGVSRLARPGLKYEVQVIALVPDSRGS